MIIFAHRGTSATEPENTLLAIQSAIDINVDGIEIDIFEVDGQLVVIHDRWLQRTTSGSGLISQYSFEKLRQLDAGKGEKIPTLDEVLAILPTNFLLNIELKGINNIQLLINCIDQAITQYGINSKQLLLSSFNHHQLYQISQQRPEFAIGALTASLPLEYAKFATLLNAYSVHISVNSVNQRFVQDAHQRGLKVFVYTVDEFVDIAILAKIGVDGIFANNPQQALEHLNNYQLLKDCEVANSVNPVHGFTDN
ncbi:glycerophosphodiester phosphodiesterase family protein [Colwellia sp. E2M01]|uniref:glycerophosphodiester phosphodiesterase n=1 Tax=Colwellia sp. E2M01 TaxID=2841561 RepID=UPI001C095E0E|nr:glycerophosphodiester phosphodiesterase family protein [Colwellia sp. E2M01]MBU2870708.1 glycerophosphodiester phosphodiesterase [Colwellia sp. E2M01]